MNNGLSRHAREMKKAREEIYGKPVERARRLSGNASSSVWAYRGFKLIGRKLAGWGAGWEWRAENTELGIQRHRLTIMAMIDQLIEKRKIQPET